MAGKPGELYLDNATEVARPFLPMTWRPRASSLMGTHPRAGGTLPAQQTLTLSTFAAAETQAVVVDVK